MKTSRSARCTSEKQYLNQLCIPENSTAAQLALRKRRNVQQSALKSRRKKTDELLLLRAKCLEKIEECELLHLQNLALKRKMGKFVNFIAASAGVCTAQALDATDPTDVFDDQHAFDILI